MLDKSPELTLNTYSSRVIGCCSRIEDVVVDGLVNELLSMSTDREVLDEISC